MARVKLSDISLVLAAFCMNACELGPLRSFGPFFIQFQNHFQASAAQSSLVSSLLLASYYFAGPISGVLSYRLGFRKTILVGAAAAASGAISCSFAKSIVTVQVLAAIIGCGCGLGNVPLYTVIGRSFSKKRSLAYSLASTGNCFATTLLPILITIWNTHYTWRGSMLIIGGIFLNIIPFGMLLTVNDQNKEKQMERGNSLKLDMLKDWKFVCYLIGCACHISSFAVFGIFLVRFGQYKGYSDIASASMASIVSLPVLFLMPVSGFVTSMTHIGPIPVVRPYVFAITCATQAIATVGLTFTSSLGASQCLCILYSVSAGLRGALATTMAVDFFGKETLETTLGLRALTEGVFCALTPFLLGMGVNVTGSYSLPFYGSAALALTSGTLVLIVHRGIVKKPADGIMQEA